MNYIFPVKWQRLFKSLTIYMLLAMQIPLALFIVIRFVSMGFDYDKTFEHLSLFEFLIILFVAVPLISGIFAFLLSQLMRTAIITLSDDKIAGRNFLGFKNAIPLSDITRLTGFSMNGFNGIVVNSTAHGKIYISEHTERLNELQELLTAYAKRNEIA